MPSRDDPRWSIRVAREEDAFVERMATAHNVSPARVVRAGVLLMRDLPMMQVEAALSALGAKVPGATPTASSLASVGAGAASSPAPARRHGPRIALVDVVAQRLGVRHPFAVRAVRSGEVKVKGAVVRDPMELVDEAEVQC